jgi:hypothetical protein
MAEWLDRSDFVGAWRSERLAAVLFPTGDTLTQLRHLDAERGDRLVLVINPQWQPEGQIISDFGCGWLRQGARAAARCLHCRGGPGVLSEALLCESCDCVHWYCMELSMWREPVALRWRDVVACSRTKCPIVRAK